MKPCHHCDYHIPDHAADCPHCRRRQKRGDWMPQVLLVMAAGAAAAAVLLEGCPLPPI